jgi:hypothetical protein
MPGLDSGRIAILGRRDNQPAYGGPGSANGKGFCGAMGFCDAARL